MEKIELKDFLPPILFRGINFAKRHFKLLSGNLAVDKSFPFNQMPKNLEVKWVMDIGANEGSVSLAALKSYPNCKVICFEPVHSTFELLKATLHPYRHRCTLYNVALSDEEGITEINLTNFHGANSILPQTSFHKECNPHVIEATKEQIITKRLDGLLESLPTNHIDIMKIDVEGYEFKVLNGALEFLSSHVDTIIIEVSLMRDKSWEDQSIFKIFSVMDSSGYALINIVDLHYVKNLAQNKDLMLVQMDCIFRKRTQLTVPS